MSMTNSTNRVEIIRSVQRRRRWTAADYQSHFNTKIGRCLLLVDITRDARTFFRDESKHAFWHRISLTDPIEHRQYAIYPIPSVATYRPTRRCKCYSNDDLRDVRRRPTGAAVAAAASETRQSTAFTITVQGNILERTFIRPQTECDGIDLVAEAAVF